MMIMIRKKKNHVALLLLFLLSVAAIIGAVQAKVKGNHIKTTKTSSSSSTISSSITSDDIISNNNSSTPKYTFQDDVSWAITHSDTLASTYHQELYNNYMKQCNDVSGGTCQHGEEFRLRMNRNQPGGVYNYTKTGFHKMKMPTELYNFLKTFYENNKEKEEIEWKQINSYHNMWESPPYFINLENVEYGGGDIVQRYVWKEARKILEEWTSQRLVPVSMYGVRIYKTNSILAPHVDRMPLVISCILNIDQELEEDWPLEVFDHDGIAHNVSMEPGDMVLYESHSIIHGRPFPMKGTRFVNTFLHFEPIGPLDDITKCGPQEKGLPPYIIPGGQWESEWYKAATSPWKVDDNVPQLLIRGDTRSLEYVAHHNPHKLLQKDYNGWAPVHEAAYRDDLDGVQFLFENGASVHDRIEVKGTGYGPNVLELVRQSPNVKKDSPLIQFLMDAMAESEL